MRKLYNEFFYIPKHGKIREKVMLARVAMTIAIMVVCLAAMSITAYAYFSYSVTSGSNMIKAANFETDVSVTITDVSRKAVENSNIVPITSDNKNFRIEGLEVGKWYNVTIKPTERSTVQTGFIIVSADGCEVTYHTQQLGVDKNVEGEYTPEIIFKLMITDKTDVILESHWGTSSYYPDYQIENVDDERYITLKKEIKMIVNGCTKPNNSNSGNEGSGENYDGTTNTSGVTTTPTTDSTTTSTETAGTSEPTTTTESSSSTIEPTTQSTESAATETTTTEITEETKPATETTETTGKPTTEASE